MLIQNFKHFYISFVSFTNIISQTEHINNNPVLKRIGTKHIQQYIQIL